MSSPDPTGEAGRSSRSLRRLAGVGCALVGMAGGLGLLVTPGGSPATELAAAATPSPSPTPFCVPPPSAPGRAATPNPLISLPPAPNPSSAPRQCPTPTPSPTASPAHRGGSPTASPQHGGGGAPGGAFFNPGGSSGFSFPAPPPTLPSEPGSPPTAPELAVQRILLVAGTSAPVAPGSTVAVQATLEATRGSDTYSVPRAPVSFAITASSGHGAKVDPDRAVSGDTGVAIVTVRTGDEAGDTVLRATSGTAAAELQLHASGAPVKPASDSNGRGALPTSAGRRPLVIAGLAAFIVSVAVALLASWRVDRTRRARQSET